jgi:hypothetical protein
MDCCSDTASQKQISINKTAQNVKCGVCRTKYEAAVYNRQTYQCHSGLKKNDSGFLVFRHTNILNFCNPSGKQRGNIFSLALFAKNGIYE